MLYAILRINLSKNRNQILQEYRLQKGNSLWKVFGPGNEKEWTRWSLKERVQKTQAMCCQKVQVLHQSNNHIGQCIPNITDSDQIQGYQRAADLPPHQFSILVPLRVLLISCCYQEDPCQLYPVSLRQRGRKGAPDPRLA